ncbi:hypothetical protein CHUAL_011503 [Chamberlinius hualienensis]
MEGPTSQICTYCPNKLKNKQQLRRHIREVHGIRKILKSVYCDENGCDKAFLSVDELRTHLQTHSGYDTIAVSTVLNFSTKYEFDEWLREEENRTRTSFTLARGIKKTKSHEIIKYECARSGIFKSRGSSIRRLKTQGSKKCGFRCTAAIIAKISKDGVEVTYFSQHRKHDFLLGHLPVFKRDRIKIAGGPPETKTADDLSIIITKLDDIRTMCVEKKITSKKVNKILDYLNEVEELLKTSDDTVILNKDKIAIPGSSIESCNKIAISQKRPSSVKYPKCSQKSKSEKPYINKKPNEVQYQLFNELVISTGNDHQYTLNVTL